jgi:broad specificity phosphatase PhoE
MKLFCIRHGETSYNMAGRIQGQSDSELSPLGRRQCEAVAQTLAGFEIEAVISSPLKRAAESAKIIADMLRVDVKLDPRLMEIHAGIFQSHTWEEIDERFPAESRQWRSHDPDFRIPGGESRRDIMQRAAEAFYALREARYRQAIVVAHGGSLAGAFKALLDIPAQRNPFSLANGSISTLLWDSEAKLLTLNETAHLHGAITGSGEL